MFTCQRSHSGKAESSMWSMPTEKSECWTHSLTFSLLIQGAGSFPSCGSVPKDYGKMEHQILLSASGWLDLLSSVIESSQLISWGKKGKLVHVLLWNQCVRGRENDRSLPVPSSCSTVTVFKHTHISGTENIHNIVLWSLPEIHRSFLLMKPKLYTY